MSKQIIDNVEHLPQFTITSHEARIGTFKPLKKAVHIPKTKDNEGQPVRVASEGDEDVLKVELGFSLVTTSNICDCFDRRIYDVMVSNPRIPSIKVVSQLHRQHITINESLEFSDCLITNIDLMVRNDGLVFLSFKAKVTVKANELAILAEFWKEPIMLDIEPEDEEKGDDGQEDGFLEDL